MMYQVGLAHAVRQPEEVILLRSDDRKLDFDITNVRVHQYDPDRSPEHARQFVTETLVSSLREVELRKDGVRKAAESLDETSLVILVEGGEGRAIYPPPSKTARQVLGGAARLRAIDKLLEMGALQAELAKLTPQVLKEAEEKDVNTVAYRVSPLHYQC